MVRLLALLFLALASSAQEDVKQKLKTVKELGKGGSEAIAKLNPYLTDGDVSVRVEAVKALVEIGTQHSLDPLIRATSDNDSEMQIRATDGLVNFYLPSYVKTGLSGSLQRMGTAIKSKFTDTNDAVVDPYIAVRPEVIQALGKLVRGGNGMDVRANAARAVGILRGKAAVPDLLAALRMRDDQLIYESLIALQKIRDRDSAAGVAFLLRDLSDRIQSTALDTVALLQNRDVLPDVRDAVQRARSNKVRRAALAALAMLPDEKNRPFYQQYFADKDESLRAAAAEGFGRLRNPNDFTMLQKAFDEERKMNPRLAQAFGLVIQGKYEVTEFSPLQYLVNTLNNKSYKGIAQPYLIELARDARVRKALYPLLKNATKDEKMGLAAVLSASGDAETVGYLEALGNDPDSDVSREGLRALRNLKARLP